MHRNGIQLSGPTRQVLDRWIHGRSWPASACIVDPQIAPSDSYLEVWAHCRMSERHIRRAILSRRI